MARRRNRAKYDQIEPQAIVAAGGTYNIGSYVDATRLSQIRQHWQPTAYDLYDAEGHLFYATNYIGSAISKIKLVAAKRAPKDSPLSHPTVIEDGPLAQAVRDIQNPRGGQSGLLKQISRNIFLSGEVWMIGSDTQGIGGAKQSWEALSVEELIVTGISTQFMRRRTPVSTPEPIPDGSLVVRIWKEHPRYFEWADSGVRSCIEVLEKIVILNRAEKAVSRSRIAGAGILGIPQELVPPNWQQQDTNADPMQSNPLYMALAESMTAPLKDDGHPASVVPLVLVGPGEMVGKITYNPLERAFDSDKSQRSITQAIEQVANTLELPKEILMGTGDATHWNAWAIREDVFQGHVQPMVEMICQALTSMYLQKALARWSPETLKAAGVDDPEDIIIWYDASQLIIHPDKSEKALGLHDRLVISDAALRQENGFSEEAKPSEEEYAKRVGVKMVDAKMALTGKPTEPPAGPPSGPAGGSGGGGGSPLA